MRCSIHNSGDPNAVTTVRLALLHFTPFLTALCIPAVSTFFLTLHPPGGGEVAWIISTRKKWQFVKKIDTGRNFLMLLFQIESSRVLLFGSFALIGCKKKNTVELLICVANQRFPFFCISDFFCRIVVQSWNLWMDMTKQRDWWDQHHEQFLVLLPHNQNSLFQNHTLWRFCQNQASVEMVILNLTIREDQTM